MPRGSGQYTPINCEFHDILESLATSRARTTIVFENSGGGLQERTAAIVDVFAKDGAEYVSLSTGETLRLDKLIEVAGEKLASY